MPPCRRLLIQVTNVLRLPADFARSRAFRLEAAGDEGTSRRILSPTASNFLGFTQWWPRKVPLLRLGAPILTGALGGGHVEPGGLLMDSSSNYGLMFGPLVALSGTIRRGRSHING